MRRLSPAQRSAAELRGDQLHYSMSTTATVGIAPLRFSSSPSLRSSNAFPVVDLRGHRWESPGRSGDVVETGGGAAHVQRSAAEPA